MTYTKTLRNIAMVNSVSQLTVVCCKSHIIENSEGDEHSLLNTKSKQHGAHISLCYNMYTFVGDSVRSIPMLGVGSKRGELFWCDTGLQTVRTNIQKRYKMFVNDEIFKVILGTATATKCICGLCAGRFVAYPL